MQQDGLTSPDAHLHMLYLERFGNAPVAKPALSRALAHLAPLLIYVALSLCYFGMRQSWTLRYQGEGNDPVSFVWYLHWWPFAIEHHLNPFLSYYVWHPDGVNLSWTTSIPLVALLLWPVTATLGPVMAFNVATVMAPALAAWTAFLLAIYLSRRWLPALFAGYFFGFSSYELGQLLGHLNLALIFLVPVAVLLCVARMRGDLQRRTFVPALAIVLAAQWGMSTEVLASLCVLGGMTWWIFLLFTKPSDREPLWRLAGDIALAAPMALCLTSPFLIYLARGMTHGQPFHTSPTAFSTDPLNFLLPTRVTLIGQAAAAGWVEKFAGNASEQGAYLGWPLIVAMIWYLRDHHRHSMTKALLVTMCAIAIMSLGPRLQIAQHLTWIRLPWHLFMKTPLIGQALPMRFTMYVALCASLFMAFWLSDAKTSQQWVTRLGVALLAAIALLPDPAAFAGTPWPALPFFQASHVQLALGKDANVLILPFSDQGPGMGWQVDAAMTFTQAAGYLGPDPGQEDGTTLEELRHGELSPDFKNHLMAFCSSHNVDYILITPKTPASLSKAISELPWAQRLDRNVVVVSVPRTSVALQQ